MERLPSSRTSTIAILDGGVAASRFEEEWDRIISDREVEERRGRVATVCVDILILCIDFQGRTRL